MDWLPAVPIEWDEVWSADRSGVVGGLFFWQIPLWKHWVTVHITTQTPGCCLAALSPLLPIQPSDPNLCLHSKQNRDANSSASRFTEIKYRSMSPWSVVSSNGFVLCPLFLHLKYVRLVVTKSCVSWARATFFWGSYDKDCYCNKPRKKTMNELFIYSICTLHALIPTEKVKGNFSVFTQRLDGGITRVRRIKGHVRQ